MTATPAPTDPLVGQILAERYQVLHRLGEGAMGVVYKARHVKVGRLFAVKILHPRTLVDSKVARRFEREAELAGRLRHPNVIGVVDVGEIDATRYMVMDFAEGPDLARLLEEAPMPPERIIRLVRQLLDGLHHAHEQGLIHRDFKPENVIVERDRQGNETPRIVDFGIALLREGGDSSDGQGRLTTNGLVLGTPHYMAPEQAVADPIDHRIDLFALGIVIYEMLSGRLPFDGSGAEVARANLLLEPPPIDKRVPHLEVDPLLEAFARRLMAKKRTARPATAQAARELLDLIERDREAAAPLLGIPLSKSGRIPATTERVAAEEPQPPSILWPETTRLKPTPRGEEVLAPAVKPVPAPVHAAVPLHAQEQPLPISPGVVYAQPFTPPVPHGAPEQVHRDTAMRTPLGWQTASPPSRRRPWLIGMAAIGAACVVAAAVLTVMWTDHSEPVASERNAPPGSAVAAAPPAPEPAPAPAPAPPVAAQPAAAQPAPSQSAPSPSPVAVAPAEPAAAAAEPPRASPVRVSRDKRAAVATGRPRKPVDPPPPAAPPVRIAASPEPAPAAAPPPTAPPPAAAPPASVPTGISAADLGKLFDEVKAELEQLPEASQRGLIDQLGMVNIMRAMRESQQSRDDAAAQLAKLRHRVRERRAGR
jgi:serine/threonine-protein kinase